MENFTWIYYIELRDIVSFLTNPLALIGFLLLLFFRFHNSPNKSGIIPPVEKDEMELMKAALAALLSDNHHLQQTAKDATALAKFQQETIQTLISQKGNTALPFSVEDSLASIAQGDVTKAESILDALINDKEKSIQESSELYKQKGALWFSTQRDKAISAYKRATELDDNATDCWNQLGHLYRREGQFPEALDAYQKALDIGLKKYTAITYDNTKGVYLPRGEIQLSLEILEKSLAIIVAFGRKDDMARIYSNIGRVYIVYGELDLAREAWKKSISLFKEIEANPQVELVQSWLDELEKATKHNIHVIGTEQ